MPIVAGQLVVNSLIRPAARPHSMVAIWSILGTETILLSALAGLIPDVLCVREFIGLKGKIFTPIGQYYAHGIVAIADKDINASTNVLK